MNILVIDGQGGRMGKLLIEQLKNRVPKYEVTAVGTNSVATSAMLKAGADYGATGENPILYNAKKADVIVGPLGIIIANALLGEITPAMAQAISESPAHKILIPLNRCHCTIVGVQSLPLAEYIRLAVQEIAELAD